MQMVITIHHQCVGHDQTGPHLDLVVQNAVRITVAAHSEKVRCHAGCSIIQVGCSGTPTLVVFIVIQASPFSELRLVCILPVVKYSTLHHIGFSVSIIIPQRIGNLGQRRQPHLSRKATAAGCHLIGLSVDIGTIRKLDLHHHLLHRRIQLAQPGLIEHLM